MAQASEPQGLNRLIELLPERDRRLVLRDAERESYSLKQRFITPDKPIESVYFPLSGIVSLLTRAGEVTVEVATIGNEGLVGLPVFLGADSIPALAFGQVPGEVLTVRKQAFREHAAPGRPLHTIVQRYAQALFDQIAQSVVCNHGHTVEQRFCRWILMTYDRVNAEEFPLTQEFLAQMLAVRRATVSEVASRMQKEGVIAYSRGVMRLLDVAALAERSCECYDIVRRQHERLLGYTWPRHDRDERNGKRSARGSRG